MAKSPFLTDSLPEGKAVEERLRYPAEVIGEDRFLIDRPGYEADRDAPLAPGAEALPTKRSPSFFVSDPWGGATPDLGMPGAGQPEPVPDAEPADGPASEALRVNAIREQWLSENQDKLSPKALSAGLKRFDLEIAQIDQRATLERMAADEALIAYVREGNDPNTFPPSQRANLSDAAWDKAGALFFQQVNGTGRATDPRVYNDLMSKAARMDPRTGRPQILDVSLAEFAPSLSPEHYAKFEALKREAADTAYNLGVQAATPAAITDETYGLIEGATEAAIGRLMDPDSPEYGQILFRMLRWGEGAATQPGAGGTLSVQEARAKAREMVASVVLNPAGFLNRTDAQGFQMDFGERTEASQDDFTIEKARAAIENKGFTINGVQITEPQLADAEEQVLRRFGEGIAPARLNELVMGYLFAEYGDVYMGTR